MSKISVDEITDEAGTGAPSFPNGLTGDGSSLTGINAFKPTTVTGVTPSLNLGSFNYFDNGTLTADTTVSFASVPTNARWSYNFKSTIVSGAFDVTEAFFSHLFYVGDRDTKPFGIFFKPDGTKMYFQGGQKGELHEYDLTTAWELSSAVYVQQIQINEDTSPVDVFFRSDGIKMYIVGASADEINEYDLSVAWDISSAVFLQVIDITVQDGQPSGIFFKDDGTKMFITGGQGRDINEYNLSTAWDISSASYSQNFDISAQANDPYGLSFKPDGTKMYVVDTQSPVVYEYNLSTPWDISSAAYSQNFNVVGHVHAAYGLFFKPDGTRMYVVSFHEGDVGSIVEYNVGVIPSVTLPASLQNAPRETLIPDTVVTYEFVTGDGGVTVNLISEGIV